MAVEGLLKASREPAQGMIATIVGIATLLLGSTAIFGELQSALDRIWRVPAAKKEPGFWHLLRTRLLSFGLVLGLGFLVIVSLVVSAALAALGKWWGAWFGGWDVFLEIRAAAPTSYARRSAAPNACMANDAVNAPFFSSHGERCGGLGAG